MALHDHSAINCAAARNDSAHVCLETHRNTIPMMHPWRLDMIHQLHGSCAWESLALYLRLKIRFDLAIDLAASCRFCESCTFAWRPAAEPALALAVVVAAAPPSSL